MRYGSVCSGIEAATAAWHPLGWQAAWFSEIEPFPCAVLDHHYPNVPNHGDMTLIADGIRSGDIDAPDILVGGTPCQAFSVAGLRNSLEDKRGQLTIEFIRILDAIDDVRSAIGEQPAIAVWENVPGVLSTKDNALGCFFAGIVGADAPLVPPNGGGWTSAGVVAGPKRALAWRVLNAQYFGVPQRRRRIFVVASARDRFNPASVLFERKGMRGNIASVRDERPGVAGDIAECLRSGGPVGLPSSRGEHIVAALTANGVGTCGADDNQGQAGHIIPTTVVAMSASGGTASKHGFGWGKQDWENGYATPVCMAHGQGNAEVVSDGSPSLTCNHEAPILAFSCKDYGADAGSISPTLRSMGHDGSHANAGGQVAIAISGANHLSDVKQIQWASGGGQMENDTVQALRSNAEHSYQFLRLNSVVRRLTPAECERLQGFPDGFTLVPYRGKPIQDCPDGPRYKALGNSMAVPVMHWIGRRLDSVVNGVSPL